jgi:putative tricarboxylic transport membrane protein
MALTAQFWGALVWLACGVFVAFAGYDLGIGKLDQPESGFVLFYAGVLIAALAIFVGVRAVLTEGPNVPALWRGLRWHKVLLVAALLIAYGVLFELLGFFICTFALLIALMLLVDPVDWRVAVVIALCATGIVDAVLTYSLKITLPRGLLAGWI